jgi:hypothetical protein
VRRTDHKTSRYAVFFTPPVTSSHLGPNILLSTLSCNTLGLCFPLDVRDQVSHPCKTTTKMLYILIFILLNREVEDKRFCTEWWKHCYQLLISCKMFVSPDSGYTRAETCSCCIACGISCVDFPYETLNLHTGVTVIKKFRNMSKYIRRLCRQGNVLHPV